MKPTIVRNSFAEKAIKAHVGIVRTTQRQPQANNGPFVLWSKKYNVDQLINYKRYQSHDSSPPN